MVYVGFGIVAASVSFLIYKQGFASLLRLLSFWSGNHDAQQQSLGSLHTPKQVSGGVDGFMAGNERLVLEDSAESDDSSKSDLEQEEPVTRNKTSIPSFTLDDAESSDKKYTPRSSEPLCNDRDSILSMASGSTSSTELLEQKPFMSMPPPPRPSRPLERLPQASAGALMPPPSRPSPTSSTPRALSRPITTVYSPLSAAVSQNSRRLPQAPASQLMAPPSPPSPNTTTLRPLPRPSASPQASARKLMPPPSPNTSTLRPLPRPSTRLQPSPPAAASLRIPPSRSAAASPTTSVASSLSTSTLAPSKRPSRKVILDPGYSPLDWAYLTQHPPSSTYLRGDSVPPNLMRIPPSLLRHHNGRKGKDAWGVWQGKVYNLTPYMKFHPGGVDELMKAAGREKDGERLFLETHPWVNWESMLSECLVGILVGEGEDEDTHVNGGASTRDSSLEEMD